MRQVKWYTFEELKQVADGFNNLVKDSHQIDVVGMAHLISTEANTDKTLSLPCIKISSDQTLSGCNEKIDLEWN